MIAEGQRRHQASKTRYDEGLHVITLRNMVSETFKFCNRCIAPVIIPFHYAIMYMIQSGEYIPCGEFISVFKKTDLNEAQILWDMIHKPASTTIDMVVHLMFNYNSYSSRKRYYKANVPILNQTEINSDSMITQPMGDGVNLANHLISLCRSTPRAESTPQHITEDFTPLPDASHFANTFFIDKIGEQPVTTESSTMECPECIEEMMVIVRRIRRQQEKGQVQLYGANTLAATVNSSTSSSTCSSNNSRNNYDQIIPTDF